MKPHWHHVRNYRAEQREPTADVSTEDRMTTTQIMYIKVISDFLFQAHVPTLANVLPEDCQLANVLPEDCQCPLPTNIGFVNSTCLLKKQTRNCLTWSSFHALGCPLFFFLHRSAQASAKIARRLLDFVRDPFIFHLSSTCTEARWTHHVTAWSHLKSSEVKAYIITTRSAHYTHKENKLQEKKNNNKSERVN